MTVSPVQRRLLRELACRQPTKASKPVNAVDLERALLPYVHVVYATYIALTRKGCITTKSGAELGGEYLAKGSGTMWLTITDIGRSAARDENQLLGR